MREPLVLPLAALTLGITASRFLPFEPSELLLAICAFSIFSVIAKWRASLKLARAACLLGFAAAGALLFFAHRPGPPPRIDAPSDEVVVLSGCVVEPPVLSEDREQFTLEIDRSARVRVSLYLKDGQPPPQLAYGQRVEIEARVRPPKNYRNPGSFDYAGYLARRQIYWNASMPSAATITVLPGICGNRLQAAIFAIRTKALERIERLFPRDTYATRMLQAILIGESSGLEKAWTEDFRRTGTYHALVISGLHISVLAGVLLFFLRIVILGELPSLAIAAAAAWLYALVSGAQAPVARAAAGFTLFLVARYFYREPRLLNLIAAVALAFLLYDPGQLFEASFQLSFLSIAAIAVLAIPLMELISTPFARGLAGLSDVERDMHLDPRVAEWRVECRLVAEMFSLWLQVPQPWAAYAVSAVLRPFYYFMDLGIISAAVQIGLVLPMIYYFHRVSLSGLTANLLIVPLMSAVVPFGFLAIFTGWQAPAWVARVLLEASAWIVERHAVWEPALRIPDPPAWLAAAFAGALLLALWRGRWRAWRSVPAILLFITLLWHPLKPRVTPGELELSVIDVGQGESLFLALPSGKLMMVDGGGIASHGKRSKPRLDPGEDVVSPYLWSRSIRRIDVVALSHAHEDHMGGLSALIENFRPTELWTSGLGASTLAIEKAAARFGVRIVTLAAGEHREYGGVSFEVISPPADYKFGTIPKNDDSLALKLSYGAHTFLLTGDIESRMEQALLARGGPGRIDVLKVAHHGSRTSTSSAFLDAARPLFAIVSSGTANPYRHPHPQVLETLSDHHVATLRTDLSGVITIRSNGRRFLLDTARWSETPRRNESPF